MIATVLILALIGSLPLNLLFSLLAKPKDERNEPSVGQRITAALTGFGVNFGVSWLICYFALPALNGPFWGVSFLLILLWVLNSLVQLGIGAITGKQDFPLIGLLIPLLLVILGVRWIAGWDMFHSETMKNMIEVVEKKPEHIEGVQKITVESPISDAEIRMVPVESAQFLGDGAIGSDEAPKGLGSQFKPGTYTLQKVRNHMVYVSPLEYQHWGAWRSTEGSPGYIVTSATDPFAPAKLVLKKKDGSPYKMKYMPSAYFDCSLERHLWNNGYSGYGLIDFTFELDDEDRPFWVVTLVKPQVQFGVRKVFGVAVIDPETGKIDEYTSENAPAWIDRIYPDDIVQQYLEWYGMYQGGYWNTTWIGSGQGVIKPVHLPHLVYGDDGVCYWFACMSSQKTTDNAMTSIVLVNSRTGKGTEHRVGGKTDEAVKASVQSELVNYPGWKACEPVPYTIYGQLTWAVPVVNEKGQFKRLALMRHDTMRMVFGDDKRQALNNYRKLLVSGGNADAPSAHAQTKTITFKVGHVGRLSGDQIGIRPSDKPWMEYVGSEQVNRELPYTLPGHEVTVTFADTGENVVQMLSFDNLNIGNAPAPKK